MADSSSSSSGVQQSTAGSASNCTDAPCTKNDTSVTTSVSSQTTQSPVFTATTSVSSQATQSPVIIETRHLSWFDIAAEYYARHGYIPFEYEEISHSSMDTSSRTDNTHPSSK